LILRSFRYKVDGKKIQKYHGMYIAYMHINKMNKTGDSYLPCIAMAHSPQVTVPYKKKKQISRRHQ
jgi:hypothetical protein